MYLTREALMLMMLAIAGTQLTSRCSDHKSYNVMMTISSSPDNINVTYIEYIGVVDPTEVNVLRMYKISAFHDNYMTKILDILLHREYLDMNLIYSRYEDRADSPTDYNINHIIRATVEYIRQLSISTNTTMINTFLYEDCRSKPLANPVEIWETTYVEK